MHSLVLCGGGFCQYTVASVDYLDLTLEQLLETKVTSVSKKIETVADAAAAVYVVTREDIARSGVTNIPDALRMVPGMDIARSDSNSWAISIRGFNSTLANKLLVLIDGRTVYNPVFGGVLWEAQELMLEDIERIEVIRGPGGTLWGANAVNGVINIITRHTRDTQGGLVSAIAGNEEQGTVSVRQGGTFGVDGSYRIYAKGFNRDSSHNPKGGDTYDEWDGLRTGFRMDWSDEFMLQGDAYRNNTQQLRPHFSLVEPYAPIMQQTLHYEGGDLLGRWVDKRDDGSQFSVQSYIDWTRRDEPYNFIDSRVTYDLEAQYNFAASGRHELIIGADMRYLSSDEDGDRNVSFSPANRNSNLYSVFVQDKIALVKDKWLLTLGSKFEHNDFSGTEIQPNIRLQWLATENQMVWSAISRAVRTPTPIEEDLTSTLLTAKNVRAAFVPNDNFKSEKLTAYELGYRNQITPGLSADLTTFYNQYDYLETTSIQAPYLVNNGIDPVHFFFPVMFTNNMSGTSHGFEAALSWVVDQDLKITLDYSLLHLSLKATDPKQKGAEQLYPKQQAGVHIFWNLAERWTLDTSTSYVGKLPAGAVDAYTRLDINLGGQLTKDIRVSLVGQNLLDKTHREFGSTSDINAAEIERSIFGKISWAF